MTTDDDPPEPGSTSRDLLVEQADAAHERAVRKLQDDVRLADRFEELEQGSRDMLFYRINRRPTAKGIRPTQPGIGNVVPLKSEETQAPAPSPPGEPAPAETPKTIEVASERDTIQREIAAPIAQAPAPAETNGGDAMTPRPVEVPGVGSTQRIVAAPVPSAYVSPAEPSERRRSPAPIALIIAALVIGGLVVAFLFLRGDDARDPTVSTSTTTSAVPAVAATTTSGASATEAPSSTVSESIPPVPSPPPSSSAIETSNPKGDLPKTPQIRKTPEDEPRPLGGKKKVRY